MAKQIIELETLGLAIGDLTFDWCKKLSNNEDVSTAGATLTERGNFIYILDIPVTEDTDFRLHETADATKYAVGILSNTDGDIATATNVTDAQTAIELIIGDLIKSAEIIHGSVSDIAPTDTVFKVTLEAPFDNVQLFDKKALTFIDGDNTRMSQTIGSAIEREAGVFELEFNNPWPAVPINGDAFLLRFDAAEAVSEAIAGIYEDLVDPESGLALEASVQAAIAAIEAIGAGSGATPAEIWAYINRSLTSPAYVLPVMQGSVATAFAVQNKELQIIRKSTPTIPFSVAGDYSAWTAKFALKADVLDTEYIIEPMATSALAYNATTNVTSGTVTLTSAQTSVARKNAAAEIEFYNGDQRLPGLMFKVSILTGVIN